jgi:DNA-binding response OmpR family regulator
MKRIVIYEEDYLTRTLLREWLSEAGYRVYLGALHDASRKWTADLVIVSIDRPKYAGALSARDIEKAHPGAPLLAISGPFRSGLSSDSETAQNLGVRRMIAKPLIRRDLVEAVGDITAMPE